MINKYPVEGSLLSENQHMKWTSFALSSAENLLGHHPRWKCSPFPWQQPRVGQVLYSTALRFLLGFGDKRAFGDVTKERKFSITYASRWRRFHGSQGL